MPCFFFALQIVLNQDQSGSCRICTAMDSIKFPVRTSFFDRPDFYLIDIQTRKMHSRLSKKQRGSHKSDVDVAMDAADLFSGADNTTMKLTFGSDFCLGPQNSVFEDCFRADAAMFSDN